jgi:CHAT domain-containing protein/tetratricopeptide (TPR) repeat protein
MGEWLADQQKNREKELSNLQQELIGYQTIGNFNQEAATLNKMGAIYTLLMQTKKAQELHDQALVIYQRLEDRKGQAETIGYIGQSLFKAGQYQKMKELFQQRLDFSRRTHSFEDEEQLLAILRQYLKTDWGIEAANGSARDLEIQNKMINREISWQEILEISKLNLFLIREAGNITERNCCDCSNQSTILHGVGWAYRNLGDYAQALDYVREALDIQTSSHQELDQLTLIDLGTIYIDLGQYTLALATLKKSLAVRQQNCECNAFSKMGFIYKELGQYKQALYYLQKALTLAGKGDKDRHNVLNYLGEVYAQKGQYSKALEFFNQALSAEIPAGEQSVRGYILNNIALVKLRLNDSNKALENYQEALTVFRKLNDYPGERLTLGNIASLLETQKQPELAIAFYKESINVTEVIRHNLQTLPLAEQKTYTETVAGTYRSLADLLIQQGRLPEAQAVLELLKLRELRDFTRDAGIDSPGINLANVEATALKQILQRYTTVGEFSQKIAACEQTHCPELQQLQDQRNQLNQAVTTELNQQRAVLAKYFSTESATLVPEKLNAEARRIVNAQPGTVLIYPLVLKDKIQFLLALKAGDGAVTFRPFETRVSAETLFKTIQTFRQQLQSPGDLAALQATSQQLYTWLIKPLEPELNNPAIKHLVFAPDSTTRYIPLAALFDGKHYLIDRYSLSTITAASKTDTSETFAKLAVNASFLLAAGASTFVNANPLDNVPAELDAIVKLPDRPTPQGIYPGVKLLNTKFDFDALKANLKGHRVLHIATHGKFQPGRPEDSYLLPGHGQNLTTALIDQLGDYGLGDIHLVVLSACETAVGDRASDGIEIPGISYFFLKNEVKAVMASLWSVNDASTSLMMQQFYKQLATGKTTKAEALQRVQQQFITGKLTAKDAPSRSPTLIPKGSPQRQSTNGAFSHPYYWAPFILIGNSL